MVNLYTKVDGVCKFNVRYWEGSVTLFSHYIFLSTWTWYLLDKNMNSFATTGGTHGHLAHLQSPHIPIEWRFVINLSTGLFRWYNPCHSLYLSRLITINLWILKMHQFSSNGSDIHCGWIFDIKFGVKLCRKEYWKWMYQLFCHKVIWL